MTIQLTPEGVRHLTVDLKLRDGDVFDSPVVEFLYEKRWAFTRGGGLGEEVDQPRDRETVVKAAPSPETTRHPMVRRDLVRPDHPAMSIRLESHDHAILDRSVKDIIEAVRLASVILHGPTPLPTRVERYIVIGAQSRRSIEVRTHKRRIDVENLSGEALGVLSKLNLPAGVCISIKPIATVRSRRQRSADCS